MKVYARLFALGACIAMTVLILDELIEDARNTRMRARLGPRATRSDLEPVEPPPADGAS